MLLCLILGIFLGLTCAANRQDHATQVHEEPHYSDVNFSDSFDWRLLKEFSKKHGNILLSPISLKITLALLYQGSNGLIEKEFKNVLQFDDKSTVNDKYRQIVSQLQAAERSEYLLNMGTSIFLDSQIPINPDFGTKAYRNYRTEIEPVNFADPIKASRTINDWVDKITHGKVSEIVETGDLQQTIMLIANAVYFKGTWKHQFPENQTFSGNFFVNTEDVDNIEIVNTRYMSTTDTFFIKESVELDSKILKLPYKDSGYSMFIILPNSFGGLRHLVNRINPRTLSSSLRSMEERLVEVHIPKVKYSFNTKLAETLRDFGFHQMFDNPASFTRITKGNNGMLVVSDIIQKSGIEIDEEGSVVYSATGVNIGNKFGEKKEVFHATHPFLFFIEGPSGTILFTGKIANPSEKQPVSPGNVLNSVAAEVLSASKLFRTAINQYEPPESLPTRPSNPEVVDYQPSVLSNQAPNLEPSSTDLEPVDMEELLYSFNLFDMELLNLFSESTTNVFISPASIKTTLAMILEGAKGSCAQEISEALRIPNIKQKGVRTILMGILNALKEKSRSTYLDSSNGIFVSTKYKINDKYHKIIDQFYSGTVNTINFKNVRNAVNSINDWVSQATEDNIKEIIGPQTISPETTAVIVNALFFKGKWKNAFDSSQTKKTRCFHTANGCVPADMMRLSNNFNYNYISRLKAHAVEIPYENNFSMLILLPSGNTNLRSVIRNLPLFKFTDILKTLNPSDITLEIPKFKFDYSSDLVENLKLLKIREIFGAQANLSGIVEDGNVIINSLVHKTRIEVDEQGTVAAAATGAIVIPLMGSTSIIADRPFIFCIYHHQTIIFEGILVNPDESSVSTGNPSFK